MPEYTALAALAVVVVVVAELRWWRSGIFTSGRFWTAMAICLFFMVLVNGRLTWLGAPVVLYDEQRRLLPRFPLDIPLEDYLFGFALLAATCARWVVAGRRSSAPTPSATAATATVPGDRRR